MVRLVYDSLGFHNSNSKPITHNPNPTIIQKIQHFCLVTKLTHIYQFLTPLFAKNDGPTHWHYTRLWLLPTSLFFSALQTQLHWKPTPTTTNDKPRNPQPQPPPPIALNTTTTSTKKSEWIKNPNPPTALNQNHNLHQKIQAYKLHHSPSLKPPQPQQKTQNQILRLET